MGLKPGQGRMRKNAFVLGLPCLVAVALLLGLHPALAACTVPAAPEGTLEYVSANKTFKFCDSADWIGVAQCGTSLGACTTAGRLEYDPGIPNFKLCDGVNWVPVANTKTLGACTTAGQIDYDMTEKTFKSCDGTNWKAWATVGGLVGHWRLNDGTGSTTAADSSGNGNDGTLANMDPATDWVAGKIGGALDFEGVKDKVSRTSLSYDLTGDLTVSAWMKPATCEVSGACFVVEFQDAGGDSLSLRYDNANQNIKIGDAGTVHGFTSTASLKTWSHLVYIWHDATNQHAVYINGVLDARGLVGGTFTGGNMDNFTLGSNTSNVRHYGGLLDDVRLYNRALSASEIAALYNGGAGCQ